MDNTVNNELNEEAQELLDKIKIHLAITWDYDDTQVLDIIDEGKDKINIITGETSFKTGLSYKLLKAYTRYAWDGYEDLFEANYKRELIQLQLRKASRGY